MGLRYTGVDDVKRNHEVDAMHKYGRRSRRLFLTFSMVIALSTFYGSDA